jgi:hypothetical protein
MPLRYSTAGVENEAQLQARLGRASTGMNCVLQLVGNSRVRPGRLHWTKGFKLTDLRPRAAAHSDQALLLADHPHR